MPRFSWHSFRIGPTNSSPVRMVAVMIGSSMVSMEPGSGRRAGESISITSPFVLCTR